MFDETQKKCLAQVFGIKYDGKTIDDDIYRALKKLSDMEKNEEVTGSFKLADRTGNPINYMHSYADLTYSLLFIQANHSNAYVIMAEELGRKIYTSGLRGYRKTFITYDLMTDVMSVPDSFVREFTLGVENENVSFIIFPLIIRRSYTGVTHYNICIYDKKNKCLERFEPQGSLRHMEFTVNEHLRRLFKEKFPPDTVVTYYDPLDICPFYGFQEIQLLEGDVKETDPAGFCMAWSMWYVDLRLLNPKKSRQQVINFAMQILRKKGANFTKFIREYNDSFQNFVSDYIKNNVTVSMIKNYGDVTIFSIKGCPSCKKAKEFLLKYGIPFAEYKVVDNESNMSSIMGDFVTHEHVQKITGRKNPTFPIIYIQKNVILGGFSDLQKLRVE